MDHKQYDVIVCGGGTAGIAAAIAAARKDVSTILVEKNSFLGGTSAMGIPYLGVFDGTGEQAAKGILEEIVQRMIAEQGSIGHVHGARWSNLGHMEGDQFSLTPFDSEMFKYVAQEMVLEAGCDLLLHTSITGVTKEGSRVTGINIFNKTGFSSIEGKVIVDTTGDADVCAFAGAEVLEKDHIQNSSILFMMSNVDTECLVKALEEEDQVKGWGWWHSRLVKKKKINSDRPSYIHIAGHFLPWGDDREVTFTCVSVRDGEVSLNATRTVGVDATNAESLTRGEISERRNIHELVKGLRKNVPGFENAYVTKTSEIGIRESRTIVGDYFLTGEEVFNHVEFPDSIVRGAYPSDIHDPKGGRTQFIFIKDSTNYGIPYGCFLPKKLDGLLMAGRCISTDQQANGTIRLQGTVVAQGQAIGTAAGLAVKQGIEPRKLDVQILRKDLIAQGAVV